jgi:hypothetical protein
MEGMLDLISLTFDGAPINENRDMALYMLKISIGEIEP